MSRITLVAGSLNCKNLVEKNSGSDSRVIFLSEKKDQPSSAAAVQNAKTEGPEEPEIVWNRRSPLSARNTILTAINSYERIDEAVLSFQPGEFSKTFHEMTTPVYDLQIDRIVKGYGYLLKELIQLFIKQESGRILVLIDSGGRKVMPPVETAVAGYLKSLTRSLSSLYQNEAFRIYCFESDSDRREEYIQYAFKTADDGRYAPGKLYKFSDRKSLFDFSR